MDTSKDTSEVSKLAVTICSDHFFFTPSARDVAQYVLTYRRSTYLTVMCTTIYVNTVATWNLDKCPIHPPEPRKCDGCKSKNDVQKVKLFECDVNHNLCEGCRNKDHCPLHPTSPKKSGCALM